MREKGPAIDFISGLQWADLPQATRRRAKLCLLDGLGVTLAGTLTEVSKITASYAAFGWRGNEAAIFLHGCQASTAGAAFANAHSANALDLDDDAIFTRGHPGAQLIPTVLAVGEERCASGQSLLVALVCGYEMAIRIGRCWHDHHETYQACGSWGSVGCAAAAANLMKLSPHGISSALGIAEYHAPNAPMMEDIAHPSMVKHAIGWGAMTGVTAAGLAARGYTGVPILMEMEKYRAWFKDLGDKYWMDGGVFYKEWSSCAWGHAAGVAALQLVEKHGIKLEEIKKIRVKTFTEAAALFRDLPSTTEEAQFSIRWPLACLLVDHQLGPEQILEKRLSDPQVVNLFDKIEIVLDQGIDQLYREMKGTDLRMHSAVEITLQDGRCLNSGIVERAADRWDEQSLKDKFNSLAGYVLPVSTVEKLIEMIIHFEQIDDVKELVGLIT
ncbi:MAG: MmgE/PrpD family protein [Bacillota bacterium]|nr:MmgE/PrpD family protein [Bacillota bacterium]